ncbi:hypothetical protein RHSIM_Rhsim08G0144600 [Rhododendron simsii]|uniref:FCP1 homology domain-containing protein n=1 Tax=Rhododendron simsii TaxID=118357 RepID=A0A834GRH1_RHOSS|nr:hypothetical protein RHSIM_Rhsim08G0144600 [Rhododendron simsii]
MFVERVGVDSVLEVNQEPNSSTEKHDDQAQVDINSSDLSSIKNCQKKQARRKRKSSGCPIGSIDEGALSSALVVVVQDNSVRDIPSNHLGKAEDGSSVLGGGEISQEKTSGGPNSELLSGKKKKKSKRKKERKLTACPMTSLGSTEEGASPSVLVVPDSSVGEISLKQSNEVPAPCNSLKLMEEVVAGNGTSLLDGGKISQEIGSGECSNGDSEFGKMKEKSKMGNLEDNKTGNGRIHQRKKRKSSACHISSLESIEEGVQESSAAFTCLNHLNEAPEPSHSGKMMEEMVAGLIISQEKASSECSNGGPVCGNERKKSKMENSEESKCNTGISVVMDVSLVDNLGTDFGQDSFVRDISSNHLGEPKDGSSIPAAGEVSQEKASGGPNSELLSWKEKKESKRKKKRKLSACPMSGLGSTEEGPSPSVLVVPDNSVGEISLKQSDKVPAPCNLVKLMEEVVAGNDTSLLDGGKISQEIASRDCPNGESDFGKKEESKMGNLEENNAGHGRIHRRKKRKSFACPISSLESIEESLQESSAGYTCLNHMDEAPEPSYTGKMEDMVAGLEISQEKASYECPVGEPASGNERKKSKMGRKKSKMGNKGNSVVMDVFMVDIPETNFEQFNKDKLDVIQNTVLSEEDRASDDALGSVPSVDNIVVDKLNRQPMLKNAIPSFSKLGAMIDRVSLESPQQSQGGAPLRNLRKKLLVLDLNGLLVDIVPSGAGGYKQHKILSQKADFMWVFGPQEPGDLGTFGLRDLLCHLLSNCHFCVCCRKNVNTVLDFLMGKSKSNLLFCWMRWAMIEEAVFSFDRVGSSDNAIGPWQDQSHCTKTGYNTVENRAKPLLLKELKNIWEKHEPDLPWASGEYNESNTLLLDDSPYKALRNPPNTAIFPHSYCYKDKRDNSLGPGGDLRVYLEGLALADHVQKYVEQNPFGQRPITNKNLSWGFYCKIIGKTSSEKGRNANDPSACQQEEEDATNDSLACQQQEENVTDYSSA